MVPDSTYPAVVDRAASGNEPDRASADSDLVGGTLLVVTLVGLALRLVYLTQPMRYDESVTYLYFAAKPWSTAIGSYLYPNNHILHTLLVKVSILVFGGAPWALRLPALLAGIAVIPLTFVAGRRLVGDSAALIGAAIAAASAPLILYATNARGYSLIVVATLVGLWAILRLRDRSSIGDWVILVAAMALGLWTVPVMLFPAGGLALWFLLSTLVGDTADPRRDRRALAIAVGATGAVTAICYAPVLLAGGWSRLVANGFVTAHLWPMFFTELTFSIPATVASWLQGIPWIVSIPLGVVLAWGVASTFIASPHRISVMGAMYVWCAVLLLVTHRTPFVRVWLWALPLAALVAGAGALRLLARRRGRDARPSEVREFAIGIAIVLGAAVFATKAVLRSKETGTLRDATSIAATLAPLVRVGDRIVAPIPSNAPLQYALLRAGMDTALLSRAPARGAAVYLVVNTGEGFTIESPVEELRLSGFTEAEPVAEFPSARVYRLLAPTIPK